MARALLPARSTLVSTLLPGSPQNVEMSLWTPDVARSLDAPRISVRRYRASKTALVTAPCRHVMFRSRDPRKRSAGSWQFP